MCLLEVDMLPPAHPPVTQLKAINLARMARVCESASCRNAVGTGSDLMGTVSESAHPS